LKHITLIIHFHTDKLALPGENSQPSASGDVMKFENFLLSCHYLKVTTKNKLFPCRKLTY